MASNAHVEMQTPSTNEIRRPFESFGHSGGNKPDQRAWETEERGGGYKAWLYVENKVHELLGPVQYEAAHDFFPPFPPPRGKQRGTGTGDRTTPFPLTIPPVCISRSVCVCVRVCVYRWRHWESSGADTPTLGRRTAAIRCPQNSFRLFPGGGGGPVDTG